MRRVRQIATVVGGVACLAIAVGAYFGGIIRACRADPTVACPPEWTGRLLPAALVLATLALIAGAGGFLFLGIFLALGLGFGVAGLTVDGPERVGALRLAACFLAVLLLPPALSLLGALWRRRRLRLMRHGSPAIGTVTAVRGAAPTLTRRPRVELTLRVEPRDGSPAFEATRIVTLCPSAPPYQEGQRYPVWFDPGDRTRFVLAAGEPDAEAPAHVRELFELARQRAEPPGSD